MSFWAGGDLRRLFKNLDFHCLFAKQTLQLLHLVLKGAIFKRRANILLRSLGRERALSGELTLSEQLVRLNAVTPSNVAVGHVGLVCPLDDRKLLTIDQRRRRSGPDKTSIFGL